MSPGQRDRESRKGAGLGRESLYKALSAGAHPRYETVSAVLRALGVKLAIVIEPAPACAPEDLREHELRHVLQRSAWRRARG